MGWSEVGNTTCPVARALAVVGDRWTVLLLRELFLGVKRFEEFQLQTGMSSHLLSTRLKRLEADEIVGRHRYNERPPRYEYKLTNKGLDLYPLLLSLKSWGEKWGGYEHGEEAALVIIHRKCGHATSLKLVCSSCDESFNPKEMSVTLGRSFASERQTRRSDV